MAIRYLLQSKKKPAPIYIRIREGKDIDVKARTNYYINPNDWSNAKGQAKVTNEKFLKDELLKNENAKLTDLNTKLETLKSDLTTSLNNRTPNEIINTQWLKDFINPPQKVEEISNELLSYFDYYVSLKKSELLKNEIRKATISKINGIKNLVKRYQNELKYTLHIKDIDNYFKLDFEKYCFKNNYAPNTIARALRYIKTICRHARGNGIETSIKFDSISIKYQKVEHIYLSLNELEQIEQTDFSSTDYLDNAKDWLIISCYTGQRVSDFMRFDKSQIRIENGKHLIEFTQVKTDKIMTLPLHKKVLSILEKRNGNFPRAISDQKYNDYIKEVCKISGLTQKIQGSLKNPDTNRKENGIFEKWELVSSHIGRRSFASNHYGKIPTSLLISATGHSTESMFLAYIGKSNTDKAQELAKYF